MLQAKPVLIEINLLLVKEVFNEVQQLLLSSIYQGVFFTKELFNIIILVIFVTLFKKLLLLSVIEKKHYMLLGDQAKNKHSTEIVL